MHLEECYCTHTIGDISPSPCPCWELTGAGSWRIWKTTLNFKFQGQSEIAGVQFWIPQAVVQNVETAYVCLQPGCLHCCFWTGTFSYCQRCVLVSCMTPFLATSRPGPEWLTSYGWDMYYIMLRTCPSPWAQTWEFKVRRLVSESLH